MMLLLLISGNAPKASWLLRWKSATFTLFFFPSLSSPPTHALPCAHIHTYTHYTHTHTLTHTHSIHTHTHTHTHTLTHIQTHTNTLHTHTHTIHTYTHTHTHTIHTLYTHHTHTIHTQSCLCSLSLCSDWLISALCRPLQ